MFQMAPILSFLISSAPKKKEPRYVYLSEAKTSNWHKMWTGVCFLISSASKNKEPRYVCLSEAKASHSHKMWTAVCFLISSGSKMKEPRYVCLSEAKASHWHKMWTGVSSSVHFLKSYLSSVPKKGFATLFPETVPASESPPGSPMGPIWRYQLTGHFYLSFNIPLFIFPSESPVREPTPCSLQGPQGQRYSVNRVTGLFIH